MKKKLAILGLAVVLVLSLVLACAGPGAGPAPEQAMEPQKWTYTVDSSNLEKFYDAELIKAFARIKERTNGLLDVRVVPNGTLPIVGQDWARAVSEGDLEMTELGGSYHAGDYPILGLIDVPYLYTSKLEKRTVWEAVRPIIRREFEKENIVILNYFPRFTQAFCTNEPVDLMNLKGKKIRSYARHIGMIIEAMGGTAVPVAWPEVYTALERGVADGLLTGADAIYANKFYEVVPYSYDVGLLHGIWLCSVNKDLWDALPSDVKEIVYQELEAWEGWSLIKSTIEMERIYDLMLAAGGKGHEKAPPEFFDLMREEVTKPLLAELLAETGAVGAEIATAMEQALGKTLR